MGEAVVLLVEIWLRNPERAGEIKDLHSPVIETAGKLGAHLVRSAEEYCVCLMRLGEVLRSQRLQDIINRPEQVRIELGELLAGIKAVLRDIETGETEFRMMRDKFREDCSCVSACAYYYRIGHDFFLHEPAERTGLETGISLLTVPFFLSQADRTYN